MSIHNKEIPDSVSDSLSNESQEHTKQDQHCDAALDQCKKELETSKESFIRLKADFDNLQRRTLKERILWKEDAEASLLSLLLPILDNFNRAFEHKPMGDDDISSWIVGIEMIQQDLYKIMEQAGVKEVPYDVFDPLYHEALLQVESENGAQSGSIVAVMEKGYLLGERVLRPAKVSVAR